MLQNLLKTERMHMKLSQKELAQRLGVSQQTIASWEVGRTQPDPNMIKKLAYFFGVSTDYLLELSPQKKSAPQEKADTDIAAELDHLRQLLESQTGLLFSGNEMDEETKEYLLASLERTLRQSKVLARENQHFTKNEP